MPVPSRIALPSYNFQTTSGSADESIIKFVEECYDDPLKFVIGAYPWGEPGPLQRYQGPDTWQTEFLIELGELIRARKFNGLDPVDPIQMTRASGHGIGKMERNSMIFDTPTGKRVWGSLKIGDLVFAEDGTPTRVTALHPQGKKKVYRVKFDDDSYTDCGADHLWKIRGRKHRRNNLAGWDIITTDEIIKRGVFRQNGKEMCKQWEIPVQGPVQYSARSVTVTPYLMGVWLGDGHSDGSGLTYDDMQITEHLREVGEVVSARWTKYGWGVSLLQSRLKKMGVLPCRTETKYVPDDYKYNTEYARAEILRGLLDTDGEVGTEGAIGFCSTSKKLAEDVIWLARSLGGKAQMQPTIKEGKYKDGKGRVVECRNAWRVTLNMPDGFKCFYIPRKQNRIRGTERRYKVRWIAGIQELPPDYMQCITVEHKSHCYLTRDFIVTHNSVCGAMITDFIMSTRPNCRGTISANTFNQLKQKTWATVKTWTKYCLTRDWFEIQAEGMFRKGSESSWFVNCASCADENSEAFAGQHSHESTSFYLFDEGSNISDNIFEVADGGLSDGESMIFIFGNPTRQTGKFYRINFGNEIGRWNHKSIDSRSSIFTNKVKIARDAEEWGEDSDRFRVRVRGLPPSVSDMQFISASVIREAQLRQVEVLSNDPLICGLDVARGGADNCVFRFRRGLDARSIPPIKIAGEKVRDSNILLAQAVNLLKTGIRGRRIDMMFVDGTGVGGPIVDQLHNLGYRKRIIEVQFGAASPNMPGYEAAANMRSWMYVVMKEWMNKGAIDSDVHLEMDLKAPMFMYRPKTGEILLESKESMASRLKDDQRSGSPDDADSLALTFAYPVPPNKSKREADEEDLDNEDEEDYDAFARRALWV